MKSRLPIFVIMLVVGLWLAGTILHSCNKSGPSGQANIDTANSTITAILKASTTATYFYYAMTRTHLDSLFNSTDLSSVFTVFVPTDSAFEASGITRIVLNAMSDSTLKRIILFLTIQKKLLSYNITNPDYKFIADEGDPVYLTNNKKGFYINGIPVAQGDIVARNGVLQFIWNSVPLPPVGDLFQITQSDTSITFFAYAMNKVNTYNYGQPSFQQLLSYPNGPYTVFVPTNHAFQSFGYSDTAAISAANQDSLFALLDYQIALGGIFTTDMANSQRANTLLGGTILFISSGETFQLKGNHNDTPANMLKTNTMATNGVIYFIDQVLKP